MSIDRNHEQRLVAWLREKGVREDCPACGRSSAWLVGDVTAPPAVTGGGGTATGGPSFPLAQIICQDCSYVMHFAVPHVFSLQELDS